LLSVARRKAGQYTECPVCGSKTMVPTDVPGDPSHDTLPAANQTPIPEPATLPIAPTPTPVPVPTPAPALATAPAPTPSSKVMTRPSGVSTKRIPPGPGNSGILEIDPEKLFGKSAPKIPSQSNGSPAKELSDYFEAIDQSQPMEGSGSQAVVVPEPNPPMASSWKLWAFSIMVFVALASALFVGFKLIGG